MKINKRRRLPAAFCGVVGFKPTAQRVFNMGISTALPGLTGGKRTQENPS